MLMEENAALRRKAAADKAVRASWLLGTNRTSHRSSWPTPTHPPTHPPTHSPTHPR